MKGKKINFRTKNQSHKSKYEKLTHSQLTTVVQHINNTKRNKGNTSHITGKLTCKTRDEKNIRHPNWEEKGT